MVYLGNVKGQSQGGDITTNISLNNNQAIINNIKANNKGSEHLQGATTNLATERRVLNGMFVNNKMKTKQSRSYFLFIQHFS